MKRAIIDIAIRVVVSDYDAGTINAAMDNFLERALQSDTDIHTQGFIAANVISDVVLCSWDE